LRGVFNLRFAKVIDEEIAAVPQRTEVAVASRY
jgi:hypothetical protein